MRASGVCAACERPVGVKHLKLLILCTVEVQGPYRCRCGFNSGALLLLASFKGRKLGMIILLGAYSAANFNES